MEEFLQVWTRVVDDQDVAPHQCQLNHYFYEKVKGSAALKGDIEYYDRLDDDHADKNCDFLMRRMNEILVERELKSNRTDIVEHQTKLGKKQRANAATIPDNLKGIPESLGQS